MANDIRMEFEEYIRELTQSISKEIFLEDLKVICDNYEKQLLRYEQMIAQASDAAERMDAFSKEEEADIKELGWNVSKELIQIKDITARLTDDYVKIFGEFSEKVNLLNQAERTAFVETLDEKIGEYETALVKRLEKEYEALFRQMIEDFEKLCQLNDVQFKDFEGLVQNARETYAAFLDRQNIGLEQMQNVDKTVEQKLKAVEEKIEGIVKIQAEVLRQFSEKVSAFNAKEREKLNAELQELLNGYRGSFAEEISVKYEYIADRFRKDLGDIYKEYESQLETYQVILQEVQKHNLEIQKFTAQNIPALAKLNSNVEENLKSINRTVLGLTNDYKVIFGAFSDRVTALNEEERTKFLTAMRQIFVSEMMTVQKHYDQAQSRWQETAEGLAQSMDTRIAEQRQSYQNDRKLFLQQIGQQVSELKESIAAEVQIQKQLTEEFREDRSELKTMQQELQRLKEKHTRDEEAFHLYIGEHEAQQREIMSQLQEMQQKMAKEQADLWKKMTAEWSKRQAALDKQKDFAAWKVFMTVTNTMLVFLLAVLVVLQKPWEVLGEQEAFIILAVFLVLLLILVFRKVIVSLFSKKDEEEV